jgi:hypothetical protein
MTRRKKNTWRRLRDNPTPGAWLICGCHAVFAVGRQGPT